MHVCVTFTNNCYCQLAHTIYKPVLVLCVFVQAVVALVHTRCSNQVTHSNWQLGCELKYKQMPKSINHLCLELNQCILKAIVYHMGSYVSICIAQYKITRHVWCIKLLCYEYNYGMCV